MGSLTPKTWEKSPNSIKIRPNYTKLHLFCFQIFGNQFGYRFGGAEGAASFLSLCLSGFSSDILKPKRVVPQVLETGCKPVLLSVCSIEIYGVLTFLFDTLLIGIAFVPCQGEPYEII